MVALQMPGWQGTSMSELAGPIVEGLDDKFLADLFNKMRVTTPLKP